jgi:hypothetical protein
MTRLLSLSFILLFISGCATTSESDIESKINVSAIKGGNIALLETYKDNSYITTSKPSISSGYYYFRNAMEAAIYLRNIDAVRYLISINAAHQTSVKYPDYAKWRRDVPGTTQWARVEVPAAELACSVGAFDIMQLLIDSYPNEKPNYTNCLHYFIASYPYRDLDAEGNGNQDIDDITSSVEKIIALGGEPAAIPNHGITLYENVLTPNTNQLLLTLLENGMDPNIQYSCHSGFGERGTCTFLADISFYEDEQTAIARAELLVKHGADINALTQIPVPAGHRDHPILYPTRHNAKGTLEFKIESMSALHMARFFDRDKLAARLIELGADPDITNQQDKTAENYAGSYAQIETAYAQQTTARQQAATNQSNSKSGASTLLWIFSGAVEMMDMR